MTTTTRFNPPMAKYIPERDNGGRRQQKIILCPPADPEVLKAAGIRKYTPPVGGKKTWCQYCHGAMWVGPNQMEYISRNPGTVQLCMACGARLKIFSWDDLGGVQHLGGVGGQYKYVSDN